MNLGEGGGMSMDHDKIAEIKNINTTITVTC